MIFIIFQYLAALVLYGGGLIVAYLLLTSHRAAKRWLIFWLLGSVVSVSSVVLYDLIRSARVVAERVRGEIELRRKLPGLVEIRGQSIFIDTKKVADYNSGPQETLDKAWVRGNRVFVLSHTPTALRLSISKDQSFSIVKNLPRNAQSVALSSDGTRIAYLLADPKRKDVSTLYYGLLHSNLKTASGIHEVNDFSFLPDSSMFVARVISDQLDSTGNPLSEVGLLKESGWTRIAVGSWCLASKDGRFYVWGKGKSNPIMKMDTQSGKISVCPRALPDRGPALLVPLGLVNSEILAMKEIDAIPEVSDMKKRDHVNVRYYDLDSNRFTIMQAVPGATLVQR